MNQTRWVVVVLVLFGMLGTLTVLRRLYRPEQTDVPVFRADGRNETTFDVGPNLFAGQPLESPVGADIWSVQFELGPPAPQSVVVDTAAETTAAFGALQRRFEVLRDP